MVRATQTDIENAVEALRAGELVVFPTETVYGLGANASDPTAVRKIFEVKGRPPDHPVIVHLDDPRYLHRWVSKMPEVAESLANHFWPGPLTLILPKAENVNDIVTGGQDSIGIRVPSHPMAQQLLNAFGGGIAAPSANRYGRLSPTKPEHVRDELGDAVDEVGGDLTRRRALAEDPQDPLGERVAWGIARPLVLIPATIDGLFVIAFFLFLRSWPASAPGR